MINNSYSLIRWKDIIFKVGSDGKLIPKRDSNGEIEVDPLTGQTKYETLSDGTRIKASLLNYMDEGILYAHKGIDELKTLIRRLQIQLELDGRVPGNSGTFADPLDGSSNKLILDKALTDIIEPVEKGTTTLKVASVDGFKPFTEVTIFDDEHSEDVAITEIGLGIIKVQALKNAYKKGAKVARSNVLIDTVNAEMGVGYWQTYSVELVEVV
ncbi:hypothetical protein [Lysinibacillus fusiformis]|uniref:hypothetical protein n=1 Tax=Lysinibacillus fusiformis TaxID=28031 RepID=UPI0011A48449|nr:hypothetical protein [Lysinibacillus fusiformis]